jgi:zinc-binding in reverse transcriptase
LGPSILYSDPSALGTITSPFWKQHFESCLSLNLSPKTPTSATDICTQPLLFNKLLKYPTKYNPKSIQKLCHRYGLQNLSQFVQPQFDAYSFKTAKQIIQKSKNKTLLKFVEEVLSTIPPLWRTILATPPIPPPLSWWQDKMHLHCYHQIIKPISSQIYVTNIYTLPPGESQLTPFIHNAITSFSSLHPTSCISHNNMTYVSPIKNHSYNPFQDMEHPMNTHSLKQIRSLLAPPIEQPRFLSKWQSLWPSIPFKPQKLLRQLYKSSIPHKIKEITYKIITRSLPLGTRIWTGQSSPTSHLCALCNTNTIESEQHLFFNCPFSKDLYTKTIGKFKKYLPPSVTPESFLAGHTLHLDNPTHKTLSLLFLTYFHTIWVGRCRLVFDNTPCNTEYMSRTYFKKCQLSINIYLDTIKQKNNNKYTALGDSLTQLNLCSKQKTSYLFSPS